MIAVFCFRKTTPKSIIFTHTSKLYSSCFKTNTNVLLCQLKYVRAYLTRQWALKYLLNVGNLDAQM